MSTILCASGECSGGALHGQQDGLPDRMNGSAGPSSFNLVVHLAGHEVLLQSIHQSHSIVDVRVQHPARLWLIHRLGNVAIATEKVLLDTVLKHPALAVSAQCLEVLSLWQLQRRQDAE